MMTWQEDEENAWAEEDAQVGSAPKASNGHPPSSQPPTQPAPSKVGGARLSQATPSHCIPQLSQLSQRPPSLTACRGFTALTQATLSDRIPQLSHRPPSLTALRSSTALTPPALSHCAPCARLTAFRALVSLTVAALRVLLQVGPRGSAMRAEANSKGSPDRNGKSGKAKKVDVAAREAVMASQSWLAKEVRAAEEEARPQRSNLP
jgi:hypothetical protein